MLRRLGKRHFSADSKFYTMYMGYNTQDLEPPMKNKVRAMKIISTMITTNNYTNISIEKHKRNPNITHHQTNVPDIHLRQIIYDEQSNSRAKRPTLNSEESSRQKAESSLATIKCETTTLNMEKTNSKEFPVFLSQCVFTYINYDNNRIVQLRQLANLEKLEILRLNQNYINFLPESIKILASLQELHLNKNYISKIPTELSLLTELRILILSYNKIIEVPICVGKLKKLTALELQGNLITILPTTISNLIFLERFGLEWFYYVSKERVLIIEGKHNKILQDFMMICIKNKKQIHFDFLEYFRQSFNIPNLAQVPFYKCDERERNLLHMACIHNHAALIQLFIPLFPDINIPDSDGLSPLMLSLQNKNEGIASQLLAQPNININFINPKLGNALILSLLNDMPLIAEKILYKGTINPNSKDSNGNTALHIIFRKFDHNDDLYKKLADGLISMTGCKVNEVNKSGYTPFLLAAKKDQSCGIKYAIRFNRAHKYGPKALFDLKWQGGKEKMSALHYAALFSDIRLIKILIAEGLNVFDRDKFNRRPLHVCYDYTIKKLLMKLESLYLKTKMKGMDTLKKDGEKYNLTLKDKAKKAVSCIGKETPTETGFVDNYDIQEGVSNARNLYMYSKTVARHSAVSNCKKMFSTISRDPNLDSGETIKIPINLYSCTNQNSVYHQVISKKTKASNIRICKEIHHIPDSNLNAIINKRKVVNEKRSVMKLNKTNINMENDQYNCYYSSIINNQTLSYRYAAVYSLFRSMDNTGLIYALKQLANVCLNGDIIYLLCLLNSPMASISLINSLGSRSMSCRSEIFHSVKLCSGNYLKYVFVFLMEQAKRTDINPFIVI